MNKNVLVTGGTGFIGSHLVKKLLDLNYNVHIIVRPDSNIELLVDCIDKISFHEYNSDYSSIEKAIVDSKPDVVFHLASAFIAQHKDYEIEKLICSNILFGTYILEAMANNNVDKLINTGTSWQHYKNEEYSPVNLYSATKQAFEDIVKYYSEIGAVRSIHLKLFDTYGKDDNRPKLMKLLKNSSISNQRLEMSEGNQLLDMVYIDDVINAFIRAYELLSEGYLNNESFGVSSGHRISLKNLVYKINEVTGNDLPVTFGSRPYRNREVMDPWSTFETLPGWSPQILLETGIKYFFEV